MTKSEMAAMRRGYLLGLEDGYVKAKSEDTLAAPEPEDAYDKLNKEAQTFADTQGDEFFQDYVVGVNYNADGSRSRGWCHPLNEDSFDMHGNLRFPACVPWALNRENPN